MGLKAIGIILIIAGCGGFGFKLAYMHIKEERSLRQLIRILDYMQCELQYRMTPLPDLCRQAAAEAEGTIRQVFCLLAARLEDQISPDVEQCMVCALSGVKDMPQLTLNAMQLLGKSLGRFDLDGQQKGLEAVRQECRSRLNELMKNRDVRLHNYQTLGLCAGAALAILLI